MNEIKTILMNKEEAEICVREIREMSSAIRENIVSLYEREGWRALGYGNFSECVTQEFGKSSAYMYRQLATGLAEKKLPIGDIGFNRESHVRVLLARLDNDDDIVRAWELANVWDESPTAQTYSNAASYVIVESSNYDTLVGRMKAGDIPPGTAYKIYKFMSSMNDMPELVQYVLSNVSDFSLVPMLYSEYKSDTETWNEIVATGHVPGVNEQTPLPDATASSLVTYRRADAYKDYNFAKSEALTKVLYEARMVAGNHPNLADALKDYDDIVKGGMRGT